ncbi:MAG: 4-hydroxy-3-methylbut-2-enyl diphosphate reductase [Bacteroidales bacterium]|nr:4-hydroxy-3-methylbut-2-enyl diphosphate reductase [Bacteroidales bacterium]
MQIEIDSNSGFCFGVVKAIETAESELKKDEILYCLGDIVHNGAEVRRLENKGLVTINKEEFKKLKNAKVLLRAHGEPPETYEIAKKNNIELIDASCPIVLNLQQKIHKAYTEFDKIEGQIVIFGKEGHAEVIGLLGHTDNKGIVVSEINDLDKIDFTKPINIFSQTTKSRTGYNKIIEEIRIRLDKEKKNAEINFISNASTCGQVSTRDVILKEFAKKHDVIIFVSGKKSSNGRLLYNVCRKQNEKSYFVSNIKELKQIWFNKTDSVGICGATSTPDWLMENIKSAIQKFDN